MWPRTCRSLLEERHHCMVEPALTAAAARGNVNVVESLLPGPDETSSCCGAERPYSSSPALFERCPLYSIQRALDSAALFCCTDIVVKILDRGDLTDSQVATALTSAAAHGDCDLIKLLLEKLPMQVDTPAYRFQIATTDVLCAAIKADRADVVQLVVGKLRLDNDEVERALKSSVHCGQVKVTKFLLQRLPQDAPSFLTTGKTTPSMLLVPKEVSTTRSILLRKMACSPE